MKLQLYFTVFKYFHLVSLIPDFVIYLSVGILEFKGLIMWTKLRNVMKISHFEINPTLISNIFEIIALLNYKVLNSSQQLSNYRAL